ncbi:MAG: restriction endonuclease subunit S [Treponema sp.]|nr:restriction endonuclease subunit S [Treponema sp.]
MLKINEYNFSSLYDIASGISTLKSQAGHGSPFVSFSIVFNNYFLPDELNELMNSSEKEQETYSIKTGDILLTRTSETVDELAMSCVALKDYPNATFSGFTKRLRPKPGADKIVYRKYLGFYLRSYLFRKAVTNHSIMTLRSSFNEEIFSLLNIYLPDYKEQVKIGDFLYTINQKIILNNAINAELEKLAKTLYNYWFVQFDFPNAKGNPYRASGGKMEYNEVLKREIPKGWEVKRLGDICDMYQPKIIAAKTFSINGKYIVYGANGKIGYYDKYNHEYSELLITCRGATCGNIHYTEPKCWITGNAMVVRPKSNISFSKELLKLYFESHNIIQNIITGSAQPQITRSNLDPLNIIVPPDEIFNCFQKIIYPIFIKIIQNRRENEELTVFRDFLLPLLMNGQVRVADDKVENKNA